MSAPDIYRSAGFEARPSVYSVNDVTPAEFIASYAQQLRKNENIELPEWVDVVKTAHGREMPPMSEDWYYIRAASVIRKIYIHKGLGVGALARWYGGAKFKGVTPRHHHFASRKVLRHILQQVRTRGKHLC